MPSRTTRIVAPALAALTAIGWTALITISIVFTEDHKPQGGLFSISLTFTATVTICEFVLWAWSGLKAHVTAERQRMSTELAALHHMVIRRFDCLEAPTESLTSVGAPMLDPKVVEIGKHLAKKINDE